MKKRLLSVPQLLFVAGTRAMFGAGVALLASRGMPEKKRRNAGVALAAVGAITTIPAAIIVKRSRVSFFSRLARR